MLAWRQWTRSHIPVVGVASGSAGRLHKAEPVARYNLFRLSREAAGGVRIAWQVRGLADPGGEIVELSRRILEPDSQQANPALELNALRG
jgi:hypothetical protein